MARSIIPAPMAVDSEVETFQRKRASHRRSRPILSIHVPHRSGQKRIADLPNPALLPVGSEDSDAQCVLYFPGTSDGFKVLATVHGVDEGRGRTSTVLTFQ